MKTRDPIKRYKPTAFGFLNSHDQYMVNTCQEVLSKTSSLEKSLLERIEKYDALIATISNQGS